MNKHCFLILCLCAIICCNSFAAKRTAYIMGFVHDRLTKENLINTKVSLMKGDSIIKVGEASPSNSIQGKKGVWALAIDIDQRQDDYTLIFEREGYNITSWPLKEILGKKPLKNGEMRFIADVPMDKAPRQHTLNGVTIKATKVKFYTKGDTLVFDADAFQTAEGSMLDALIKQLPGAELNDDGEIYVNGRKVESLLLNGEYFFKGNNKVMLENLPAYTVKTIKTYEKRGIKSQMMGRDMGDKEFVMDVGLKKEYSIGWIANAEAGAGTKDRYLARLFALRFTPKTRLTLYGNMNNLNDTRKPGENSSWTPETMPSGLLATKMAGADFLLRGKNDMNKWNGSMQLTHSDLDSHTETTQETFLTGNNVFARSLAYDRNKSFSLQTKHTIELWKKDMTAMLQVNPSLSYSKTNSRSRSRQLQFNQDPQTKITNSLLDSIYEGTSATLNPIIANRNLNYAKQDGHKLDMNLDYGTFLRIGGQNNVMVSQEWEYSTEANDRFRQQQIVYPNDNERQTDSRNRYSRNQPQHKFSLSNYARYTRILTNDFRAELNYGFIYSRDHHDYNTYRIDQLEGWDDFAAHQLGELPSQREYATAIDRQNSYSQILYGTEHQTNIGLQYNHDIMHKTDSTEEKDIGNIEIIAGLNLDFSHDWMDYRRGSYDGVTRRNNTFLYPTLDVDYSFNEYKDNLTFHYKLSHTAPSMLYTTDTYSNEDPLNLYYYKAHLQNTRKHEMNLVFSHKNQQTQENWSVRGDYNIYSHSVAMGYVYDRQTGIRTFSPANVSGNYNLSLQFKYARPLDKPKRLTFDNAIYGRMSHGVDLVSDDTGNAPTPNGVMTYWATDRMNLKYKFHKALTLGAKGYVGYGRSLSSRSGFADVHVCDFHYGLTGLLTLPWQFQLSTDLTMYSRRGYAGSGNNTNDLVWNARFTKTFTKAGVTLAIDGFDILGNLSNTSQLINTQGRTETYKNSLPSYVMIHFIYRLNKQPKKK